VRIHVLHFTFYLHLKTRWPHVRPDQVIPEESWLGAIKETNLTKKLSPSQFTKRASWTDGLLEREDGTIFIGYILAA